MIAMVWPPGAGGDPHDHCTWGVVAVSEGPVLVENNLFLHPFEGSNGAQIKLLSERLQGGAPADTIRNVEIRDNTFVGNWLSWWNEVPLRDVYVRGNRFAIQHVTDPPFHPDVVAVPTGSLPRFELKGRRFFRQSE